MKSDTFTHAANLHSLLAAAVSRKWRTIARHAIHARLSLPLTLIFRQDSIDICSVSILDHLEAVDAFAEDPTFHCLLSIFPLSIQGKSGNGPGVAIFVSSLDDSCGALVNIKTVDGEATAGGIRCAFESRADVARFITR